MAWLACCAAVAVQGNLGYGEEGMGINNLNNGGDIHHNIYLIAIALHVISSVAKAAVVQCVENVIIESVGGEVGEGESGIIHIIETFGENKEVRGGGSEGLLGAWFVLHLARGEQND